MYPPPPTVLPPPPPPASGPPSSATGPAGAQWAEVLRSCGWPTALVCLDFETYFDADYHMKGKGSSGLSTIEYIEDHRFGEIGLACLEIPEGQPYAPRKAKFWTDVPTLLKYLQGRYGENLEGCTVCIQNARFDGTILVRKHGISPPYVVDVRDLSRHLDARNTHNLKDMCDRYGLPPKGDTMQFKGKHWATMTPAEQQAMCEYACNDAERETDLLAIMLPKLTRPEVELPLSRHTLRLFWEPELCFDFAEADRLAGLMQAQIAKDTEPLGLTPKQLSGDKSFVKLLAEALAATGEQVPMKMGTNKMIPALAKDDEGLKSLKIHRTARVRELIKARQAVESWPLHIKRLHAMADQARAAGRRLPNPLNYYGAHTGRWSGAEGINTCNLPTRGSGLQTEMKHCLIAPEGCLLVLADAAQIEARGNSWIAGQDDLTEAFRQDRDVYSEFAADVLAAPCRKPMKDDPPLVARLYGARRAIGKTGILGMGYGMGAVRALEYMQTYPELAPKIETGEIDLLFCKNVVETYRAKYAKIPKFWRDLENVFKFVVKYGQTQTLRGLTLSRSGSTVEVRLPSGRSLFYPHAAISGSGREERLRFRWGDLWGGTLTENVVQAASRDVLAEAILKIEAGGYRVGAHVYDSVVVVVPEDRAEAAKKCVEEAISTPPAWCPGWPMGVEASISERYE